MIVLSMRKLFALLLAGLTAFLVWLADTHHPLATELPALGRLLNPFTGFWANAESPQALPRHPLELPAGVQVKFDERLVPHIFAPNLEGALYAQGYVMAMHRLWQMDLLARVAGGRLAEVLGERLLPNDLEQRRKGMRHSAQALVAQWQQNPTEKAYLESFTAGVNAYIEQLRPADYPLEFKLLGYAPERWTLLHSMLIYKNMVASLAFRQADLAATNTRQLLGLPTYQHLFPAYNPKQSPIIPAGTPWDFKPIPIAPASDSALMLTRRLEGPDHLVQPFEGIGSNNWAVGKSKTKAGRPILCNDPHLELTLPSIWYELQIHTPELNAYGVNVPGLPGISIGFNEHVAWGITNVGHDVVDWYAIKWLDAERQRYAYDGGVKSVAQRFDTVWVRGRTQPVVDTIRETIWGPLVYDHDPQSPYYGLAMHWLANEMPPPQAASEVGALIRLMQAKNYADYANALQFFGLPASNFVFASRSGDIALWVNGRLPLRRPGQGVFVQDGSSSANGWAGYVPHAQLPHHLNPTRGFVSSANQHSTAPDYPYFYHGSFEDYRGRILNRRLESMQNITLEDLMRLQNSPYSLQAEEATPLLLSYLRRDTLPAAEQKLAQALANWDYNFDYRSSVPVLYKAWLDSAYNAAFDEMLRQPKTRVLQAPKTFRFLELLAQHPRDPIFDDRQTRQVETARDIVRGAWRKTMKAWRQRLEQGYTWQEENQAGVQHLARIPAFSARNLPISGHRFALNAISGGHGPSWRMAVELGDEIKAFGVLPGGQSGNPGHPNYDASIGKWAKGEYHQLFFMQNPGDRRQRIIATWQRAAR